MDVSQSLVLTQEILTTLPQPSTKLHTERNSEKTVKAKVKLKVNQVSIKQRKRVTDMMNRGPRPAFLFIFAKVGLS